jgi:hypothetical protein
VAVVLVLATFSLDVRWKSTYALVVVREEEESDEGEDVHDNDEDDVGLEELVPVMSDGLDDVLEVLASFEDVQKKHPVHNGVLDRQQRQRQQYQIVGVFEESEGPEDSLGD